MQIFACNRWSKIKSMRASNLNARRHFAHSDEELQDSDQTLSAPAGHSKPRARLLTSGKLSGSSTRPSRRRFSTSAFFSDSTDDDVSRPFTTHSDRNQLSMSQHDRSTLKCNSRTLLNRSAGPREGEGRTTHVPRLHVDAIEFPVTRSVLWDRRPLSAAPIEVSLEQIMPRFIVSAKALKEIYKLYGEKTGEHGSCNALCYAYGDMPSIKEKKVLFQGVQVESKDAKGAGTWCVPVCLKENGNSSKLLLEKYVRTIKAAQNSYRDEYTDSVSSKLQLKLFVFRSSPHAAQLDFQLECASSSVLFKFTLVRNLPLLMTPLAASLAKREFNASSGNLRSGYLTLDRTRKAVPLLKVDPLVLQHPVVGIWVYGIQIDDAWDEGKARRQLADPFLYFACIGYLMSETIKERVGPNKNTFLVALYSANDSECGVVINSLPRFFECSFSEFMSSPATPLPIELFSYRRSCFVGVSKFSSDVEFILTSATSIEWEEAKRQAKIPAALLSTGVEDSDQNQSPEKGEKNLRDSSSKPFDATSVSASEEEKGDSTSGWTISANALRKSILQDANARGQGLEICKKAALFAQNDLGKGEEMLVTTVSGEDQYDATRDNKSPILSASEEKENNIESAKRDCASSNIYDFRSCCKSQQLLTIQHQQILENQQKQLHEMQEQISQLRCFLQVARHGSNHGNPRNVSGSDRAYDSVGTSPSTGAAADVSVASTDINKYENSKSSSHMSLIEKSRRFSGGSSSFSSDPDNDKKDYNKDDVENEVDHLSSLNLSSISSNLYADSLSPSSSRTSGNVKQLRSSRHGENRLANAKKNDFEGEISTWCQVSQSSANSLRVTQQIKACANVEAEMCSEQEVGDGKASPRAHKLSIDELNSSATNKATVKNDSADLTDANEKVDDILEAAADISGNSILPAERLLLPDDYLCKVGGFVDHHGGCFTTPPLDFHSFCVPRIKLSAEISGYCLSDSEDEEVRLIEQKYKRLMAT